VSENLIQIASPVFGWFGGFCRHFTYAQLATDGQTNRQTSLRAVVRAAVSLAVLLVICFMSCLSIVLSK